MNWANEIKERVTMNDVVKKYTSIKPKKNRMPCVFHNGVDYNLGFDKNTFNCFVCGTKGDSIEFVKLLFNIDFRQTIQKLNYDFALNLPIGNRLTIREKENFRQREVERKKQLQKEKEEAKKREDEYWRVFDEWKRLDDNRREYKPKSIDETLHPLFVEALQKITYQEYLLTLIEIERKRS